MNDSIDSRISRLYELSLFGVFSAEQLKSHDFIEADILYLVEKGFLKETEVTSEDAGKSCVRRKRSTKAEVTARRKALSDYVIKRFGLYPNSCEKPSLSGMEILESVENQQEVMGLYPITERQFLYDMVYRDLTVLGFGLSDGYERKSITMKKKIKEDERYREDFMKKIKKAVDARTKSYEENPDKKKEDYEKASVARKKKLESDQEYMRKTKEARKRATEACIQRKKKRLKALEHEVLESLGGLENVKGPVHLAEHISQEHLTFVRTYYPRTKTLTSALKTDLESLRKGYLEKTAT